MPARYSPYLRHRILTLRLKMNLSYRKIKKHLNDEGFYGHCPGGIKRFMDKFLKRGSLMDRSPARTAMLNEDILDYINKV